jgi:serine-type D-Ala-D-Ala carboxypeptidase (penicillin-binding protein 5/6)
VLTKHPCPFWSLLSGVCLTWLLLLPTPVVVAAPTPHLPAKPPAPASPVIDAHSALLVDPATGTILFQKDVSSPFAPASTTKLLTALLVYEHQGLNGTVLVDKADTEVEPSHIPLIAGETVSVHDLVYALLIGSDNDAAMALARNTAGSVPAFLALMNARARELGCTNSNFKSPNGLPMPDQYTSASDLLKIFQAAIAIPELRKIASTKDFRLTTQAGTRDITNHNKLLGKYEGMGPAKTGWTVDSRHTYAAAVDRNGRELQLTLLDSKNGWNDAEALFDYGFAHLPPLSNAQAKAFAAKNPPAPTAAAVPEVKNPPAEKNVPVPAPASLAIVVPTIAPLSTTLADSPARENATPSPTPAIKHSYTVKKGDTLSSIAAHAHSTVGKLIKANPKLADPDHLKTGQVLALPA